MAENDWHTTKTVFLRSHIRPVLADLLRRLSGRMDTEHTWAMRHGERVGLHVLDLDKYRADPRIAHSGQIEAGRSPVRVEILSASDRQWFDTYVRLRKVDVEMTTERLDAFLANGCLVILLVANDAIIAATSVARCSHPLFGFHLDLALQPNQAYTFNTLVLPEWRGRGLAYSLKHQSVGLCREDGVQYMTAAIYELNLPGVAVCSRIGFIKYGTLTVEDRGLFRRYEFRRNYLVPGFRLELNLNSGGKMRI